MRRLAVLASLVAISGAQAGINAEFDEPMALWGTANLTSAGEAEWATLVPYGSAHLVVDEGAHVFESTSYWKRTGSPPAYVPLYAEERSFIVEATGALMLAPLAADRPLAIEGTGHIEASLTNVAFTMAPPASPEFDDESRAMDQFRAERLNRPEWTMTGTIRAAASEPTDLDLTAKSVGRMSWEQGTSKCLDLSPCPGQFDPLAALADASGLERRHYVEITGKSSNLALGGTQTLLVAQAIEWAAAGPMAARMPNVAGEICERHSCSNLEAFRVSGDLDLNGIRAGTSEGRMSAEVDGDISAMKLDNRNIAVTAFAATATVTLFAAAAVLASKLGLFSMFTRLKADEALEHPRRATLYAFIQASPGATFREIVRQTEIPTGTARHHLSVLRRSELIVEKPHKSTLRFFENHGKFDATWDTVVMLREPALKTVHEWLSNRELPTKQKDIVDAMAIGHGWSRGTTQHRLGRLVDSGLVTYRQQGRLKLYVAHTRPQEPAKPESWNGLDASWPEPSFA